MLCAFAPHLQDRLNAASHALFRFTFLHQSLFTQHFDKAEVSFELLLDPVAFQVYRSLHTGRLSAAFMSNIDKTLSCLLIWEQTSKQYFSL